MRLYFPEKKRFRWILQQQDCHKLNLPAPVDFSRDAPVRLDDGPQESEVKQAMAKTAPQPNARAHRFLDQVEAVRKWWTAAPQAKPGPMHPKVAKSMPKEKPLESFDLQDVPQSEEAYGFKLDPKLMRLWFGNAAYAVQSIAQKKCLAGANLYPAKFVDASNLNMSELMTVERIRLAVEKIKSREYLDSKPVRDALQRVCSKSRAGYGYDIEPTKEFGGDLQKMHRKYTFASITVGKRFSQDLEDIRVNALDKSTLATDDVALALGDFKVYAAIEDGHVFYNGTKTRRVHVKEIAVYILAPYGFDEFEQGIPYLGHFNKKIFAMLTDGDWVNAPIYMGKDMHAENAVLRPVSIPLFIQWRQRHERGGDMLLFSDRMPSFTDIDMEIPLEPTPDRLASPWKISDAGVQFLAVLESGVANGKNWHGNNVIDGMILKVYDDGFGIPTVGMGHKVTPADGLKLGDSITIEQARTMTRNDLADSENAINQLVSVPLHQHEYDALVSILFNTGIYRGPHDASSLRRSERVANMLNQGDYDSAAVSLGSFFVDRIPARRKAEVQLFKSGVYDAGH